jgi:hypothetical protein
MTFINPKPGGWAFEEELTSGDMNDLLAAIEAADVAMAAAFAAGDAAIQAQVTANLTTLTATRREALTAGARLWSLDLNSITPTDVTASVGVCSSHSGSRILVVKGNTNGVFGIGDAALVQASGITAASITSECRKVVFNGSRHLAVGLGGNRNTFSTNNGASWSAGGASALAADPIDCVWNGTRFIMCTGGGDSSNSVDGVAWVNAGGADDIANAISGAVQFGGLAVLTGGGIYATGNGSNQFARSTDNGDSWAATSGDVPNEADYVSTGWIAGNGGSELYWLGNPSAVSTTRLDLCVSTDGNVWTKRSEIITATALSANPPKLFMCQDTGILLAAANISGGIIAALSDDLGLTWSDTLVLPFSLNAIGIARGRIIATVSAKLFASNGTDL